MDAYADEELVARIPDAVDEEANRLWEELCARHELLLRAVAGRVRVGYLDLCSELYLHLRGLDREWRRLRGFRAAGGAPFRNWLAVVASRAAAGLRSPGRGPLPPPDDSPAETEPERECVTRVDVFLALSRLKHTECRVLLRRRYWAGESFEELAGTLGRTAPALRQMHRRNLRELGRFLRDDA
jgi:DNA-directed RNA polymerase specialized sigma24 family protein